MGIPQILTYVPNTFDVVSVNLGQLNWGLKNQTNIRKISQKKRKDELSGVGGPGLQANVV